MFPLNACSGIVAAKEMLARNIFELREEKLNLDLEKMDEEEIQKLDEEEELDSIRNNMQEGNRAGLIAGSVLGAFSLGCIVTLKRAKLSILLPSIFSSAITLAGGYFSALEKRRDFNAQEKPKDLAKIRIFRLREKISFLATLLNSSDKYSETDIKQFEIAKNAFAALAAYYTKIDQASSPIFKGMSDTIIYGPYGAEFYSNTYVAHKITYTESKGEYVITKSTKNKFL